MRVNVRHGFLIVVLHTPGRVRPYRYSHPDNVFGVMRTRQVSHCVYLTSHAFHDEKGDSVIRET